MSPELSSVAEKTLTLKHEDGRTTQITARPMPVARYPRAVDFWERKDLLGLAALWVNQPVEWALTLTPEAAHELIREFAGANPFFFAFAAFREQLTRALAGSAGADTSPNSPSAPG